MMPRLNEAQPQEVRILDEVNTTGDVLRFYKQAKDMLGRAVYGEEHAKDEVISGMVDHSPVILSGLPGGGKSVLSECAPFLVEGMSDNNIALFSGQHDTTANQLIGGTVDSMKRLKDLETGKTQEQEVLTVINGILKVYKKFIRLEESNRANPLVVNSLLPVLESRRIENSAGELEMPDLISVILTMNPQDFGESTFEISDAAASRLKHGAEMGRKGSREERKQYSRNVRAINQARVAELGPKSRPLDMMSPVVTEAGLVALWGYVLDTAVDSATEDKIDDIAINVADILEDKGTIQETDGRIGQQISGSAKTLGGLRNKEHYIKDVDLRDATRSVLVARLGAKQRTDHLDLEKLVDEASQV